MAYMRFYMTPGSCSTGIHILLEEIGEIFQVFLVDLMAGDNLKPEYLAINPRGSVPALVLEDGKALTTWQEIACGLAGKYPEAGLMPESDAARATVMKIMDYAVNHMHGEGFARIFVPERFSLDDKDAEDQLAFGRRIVEKGFAKIEKVLEGCNYVSGKFGIADAALFYIEFWADRTKIPMPPNCLAHYERMLQRQSVQQILMEEGYGRVLNR